jgi:F plasmid transfer operon, TraF, protein
MDSVSTMNKIGQYLCILPFAAASLTASALPFSFEARSLAMGNARVATADIATAPFANPAMLSFQPMREDFSMLLGVGGFLRDDDGVADLVDQFKVAYDNYQVSGNSGDAASAALIAQQLEGKIIAPELTAAFATGFSGEHWSIAVSARADVVSAGTITNVTTTQEINGNPDVINDPTRNLLEVEGVLTTELGLSVARNFQVLGQKLAVGITPRYIAIENVYISESIATIDTDLSSLLDEKAKNDLGNFTTYDVGLVMSLTEHVQVGLVVSNLVAYKVKFITSTGKQTTLSFDTQARAGIAYRNRLMTLGLDVDLLDNDPLLSNPDFQKLKTRYASIGAEFNAFDFAQLRFGVQKNIASDISESAKDNLLTAGVGFWFGFNLDLAVIKVNDSLGAFLQTGVRF